MLNKNHQLASELLLINSLLTVSSYGILKIAAIRSTFVEMVRVFSKNL